MSSTGAPQPPSLPHALGGERIEIDSHAGRLSFYLDGPPSPAAGAAPAPMLLVHSVNAAASAYEVKPLFDHYRGSRPVLAIDLPGYGFSERSERVYTARLMTDAVLAAAAWLSRRCGGVPVDAVGVSLAAEFVARAAVEQPALFRSAALVSPTGFDRRGPYLGPPGSDRGKRWLLTMLGRAPWSEAVYRGLTKRSVIRWFLEKTWGSKGIDEGLLDYDVVTTQQPGASRAPFYFVSACLFSADVTRLYDALDLPVWMTHGTRGDFVDYSGKKRFVEKTNWKIDELDAGALPYFEDLPRFAARFDAHLFAADAADGAGASR